MAALDKTLESKIKIRFHDCDPYNHLNNSKYIDYIMTARGDQLLDHYGFDMYALAREEGIGWVTAQTQISYLIPAFPMEEVAIQTQLVAFTAKSLLVEGIMWNHDKTKLKTVMWIKFVHFNMNTQKSHEHSENLMQFFQQIVNPLHAISDFEQRIESLKQVNYKSNPV
jgi:acyl-CoA thioester hydrolase